MNQQNKKYKSKFSGQISRKRRRNAEKNRPRLEQLKEIMGCYQCGRSDIPGKYLDGHHLYGKASKHKPLSHHCSATWRKVIDELLGVNRERGRSGGPCVMVCQRFHEAEIKYGEDARPCTHPCFQHVPEPYRVRTRLPGRIRDQVEDDGPDAVGSRLAPEIPPEPGKPSIWRCFLRELKSRFTCLNFKPND